MRVAVACAGVVLAVGVVPGRAGAQSGDPNPVGAAAAAAAAQPAAAQAPALPDELATLGIPVPGSRGNPWTAVMQQWLRDAGFRPGPVDAIYGPVTAGAVMRFQQAAADAGQYSGPVDGAWSWATSQAQLAWAPPAIEHAAPTPGPAGSYEGLPCDEWHGLLEAYGLPVPSFARIMWRESGCNPGAVNPSSGARGLLQIMPQWATQWGGCELQGICSPDQLLDPEANVRAAAQIFAVRGYGAWSVCGGSGC